jgi:hypothetical protein
MRASVEELGTQGGNSLENCSTLEQFGKLFYKKKARLHWLQAGLLFVKNPAIPTFALVGTIIGSESLTTVFGMGTGGPFGYGHRERATGAVAHCDPYWSVTRFWIGKCNTYAAQFNIDLESLLVKAVSDSTQPFAGTAS